MKKALYISALAMSLLAVGCAKEPGAGGVDPRKPSPDFSWQTTKQAPVNVVSADGRKVPVFVYQGDKVIASGYTPFNQEVTVPIACEQLTVASVPLSYNALFGSSAVRSDASDADGVIVNVGDDKAVTLGNKPVNDYHTYLVEQAQAWLRGGATWKQFVHWWNTTGGTIGHSGINVYQNRPPITTGEGASLIVVAVPHNCHDKSCSENIDDPVEEDVTSTVSGTYIFEDLFPSMGDYDMNDFVVEQIATRTVGTDNVIKKVSIVYNVNAVGSSADIAMAVYLPGLTSSAIQKVELFRVEDGVETPLQGNNTTGLFSVESNGLERSSASEAVIPVFDKFSMIRPSSSIGKYFNTDLSDNAGKGAPVQVKVVLTFAQGAGVTLAKFTPDVFIMPRMGEMTLAQQRSREIHVVDAKYTALMDQSLFGTGADASVPPSRTFRTEDGYVWGIYLPVTGFRHSIEKTKIGDAYTRFDKWVLSGGLQEVEWYKFPSEGKVWTW